MALGAASINSPSMGDALRMGRSWRIDKDNLGLRWGPPSISRGPMSVSSWDLARVEQRRVYSIYYYGTLTLPCKRRGERAVGAVAGREQETLLLYTCYRLLYILSYKCDGHSCIV